MYEHGRRRNKINHLHLGITVEDSAHITSKWGFLLVLAVLTKVGGIVIVGTREGAILKERWGLPILCIHVYEQFGTLSQSAK